MLVSRFWIAVAVAATVLSLPARAHEFWIEPEAYRVAPQDPLVAHIRVGQEFKGPSYAFLPRNFSTFVLETGGTRIPVEGTIGDRPALNQRLPQEGLATIVHATTYSTLNYETMAKFEKFVTHKDALWTLEEHAARGLPDSDFREAYSRHAKSLVAVGAGAGSDRAVGLVTEIVAEANPYTDDLTAGLPVRVLYQGAPRADAQVEIFDKSPGGDVEITLTRTDADGRALIPVTPGHSYLLDAVVLRKPSAEVSRSLGVVWESLWASLTFAVPGPQ